MKNIFKKQFLYFNIFLICLTNPIKANLILINRTQNKINIYPTSSAIKFAIPTTVEFNKKISLDFPTKENFFVIRLGDELFFQFFYNGFKDNETYTIFFGINDTKYKYSCILVDTNKHHQDGILFTALSLEQLNNNFSPYKSSSIETSYVQIKTDCKYPDEITILDDKN